MERIVIVIVGPTCSGKTFLSLKLAGKLNTEIISADSRQFYKKLDIGTAKPTKSELNKIKHHFINSLDIDEEYSASRYEKEAEIIINQLHRKNKIPIVTGGSGLYLTALTKGIFDTADKDEHYRAELLELRNKYGNEYLHNKLIEVDPESAKKMIPQNWKRIIRALEVYHLTGEPIWKHHLKQKKEIRFNYHLFGLNWKREVLYNRINERVDTMIKDGLVEEVKSVLAEGYDPKLNSLNTVGYKEIISYLDGEINLERAVELIKRNTRRYAKRQVTWFKKDENIFWFDVNDEKELLSISESLFKKFNY